MSLTQREFIVVGDSGSGKTSLLRAYLRKGYMNEPQSTVYDCHVANVKVDGRDMKLKLVDTPGKRRFRIFRSLNYRNAHGIILCFAVNDRDSFKRIGGGWITEIREFCLDTPIILVRCKMDLRQKPFEDIVSVRTARALQKEIGAYTYLECSAHEQSNVDEIFNCAIRSSIRKKARLIDGFLIPNISAVSWTHLWSINNVQPQSTHKVFHR
ncbi:Rho GTPase Rho1 [Aspergillus sclerotiicarbonarius CBS 121057]|uniref:Rho GTPase Rho1 n=1 Tax=Aspergillus sclerotiicarbonarius (strain CBS 121057 / IBT 28362) TaxID=1448318 RepID=A0A319EFR4_ASPSB|nr:Rho GTPase Rho1 [Aspergillus sclerotiicarbonarius CBS 121057]